MAPACQTPAARFIVLASSLRAVAGLGRLKHTTLKDDYDTDSTVISEGARKLEYQVRLRAKDMTWAQDSFMRCLDASLALSRDKKEPKEDMVQRCLALNQERCGIGHVQPVCAWAAGFGSGVHMWVHSFTYALEQGLVWVPTGPWSYVDEQRCPDMEGVQAGASCYFKDVTKCPVHPGETLPKVCAQWYNRHNGTTLVINAAKKLSMSREWVWGQLTSYMLQMLPDVQKAVDSRIPQKLKGNASAAIQIRVVSAATGQDGMRVNLGVDAYLKHLEDKMGNLKVHPKLVYVMSDDPSLNETNLNAAHPQYEFLRPVREWADVARGSMNETQSKTLVTYDLLADLFAAVESEVFIGTASNLFWLIYALKQAKKGGPGINCWINTVEASPEFKRLFCPGDPGFYTYSPPGLRPSVDEEYVALLRDGLDRKSAWKKAIDVNHHRTKLGAMF